MMHVFDTPFARVYATEIGPSAPGTRRQAERLAVRGILDECLGPEVELRHSPEGAPLIDGWHVSISHSRRVAVVALSRTHRIGVDAEEWREALLRVAERFLSPIEQRLISTGPRILRAWTVKEAVYKAAGAEAYEYAQAISILPDMQRAWAAGKKYVIETWRLDDTVISLAVQADEL